MQQLSHDYYNRIREAVLNDSAMARMTDLLRKHTVLLGRPYSFHEHEYQIDICNSTHHNLVAIKPSQVGFTTFTYYSLLMMLAVTPEMVGILALPTVHEAQRMAKSRIDPIIHSSKYLKQRMSTGNDSASFKQIGTSQLFLVGTQKPLISIPCDLLVIDELDFCVKENLITAESRMSHSRFRDSNTGVRGFRRRWSTPTATGIGVSALYELSDQRKRLVKCKKCSHWFWPNFLEHCVVDGFNQSFRELTYFDVGHLEQAGKVDTARLLCEKCHHPLSPRDLGPAHREWVAAYPDRKTIEGWQVSPFDLPAHHTPASIMRQMGNYRGEVGHFYNFVLGFPHDDASNSVLDHQVQENTRLVPVPPEHAGTVSGTIVGIDVGKTSWLIVGKVMGKEVHIIWIESIRLRGDAGEGLYDSVRQRLGQYGAVRVVMDAMPYTDVALKLQAESLEGTFYPCQYTLRDRKLPAQVVKESEQLLEAHRTKTLNRVAKRVNSGEVIFPRLEEMRVVRTHLQGMKRVDRIDDAGESHSDWVKGESADDHYFHALNYLLMAAALYEDNFSGWSPLPSVTGARVGKNSAKQYTPEYGIYPGIGV